jgi:serine kinase of HPr protein (carbohydrate metabolism regulator)
MDQFHATAVAYYGSGILIRGPSGSGKSDLALRLIDDDADLIADDRVVIKVVGKELRLSPPESISGLIEVRGIGVVKIKTVRDIPLCLVVELELSNQTKRMPEIKEETIKDISIPIISINAFESSSLAKIKIVLRYLDKKIELIS